MQALHRPGDCSKVVGGHECLCGVELIGTDGHVGGKSEGILGKCGTSAVTVFGSISAGG